MQDFIIRANIERFQRLLAQESDAAKRERLNQLLADEREKLRTDGFHPGPISPHWMDDPNRK